MSDTQVLPFVRRVGLIGDVHAEDTLLATTLAYLKTVPDLDALLCTGDIPTGQGDADRCCRLLQEANVLCVRGNHERWFVASKDGHDAHYLRLPYATVPDTVDDEGIAYLSALPVMHSFDTPLGPVLLSHGTGPNDMDAVYPQDSRAVLSANHRLHAYYSEGYYQMLIGGHTHERMLRKFDHLTILNAGTLRRDFSPAFLVVDFAAAVVQVYEITPETLTICPAKEVPL
jgi:predicted phosphodiesterase